MPETKEISKEKGLINDNEYFCRRCKNIYCCNVPGERFGRERFRNPSSRFITIQPELIKVCPILLALLSSNQSEKETSEKHT